jgi:hypothetical protein
MIDGILALPPTRTLGRHGGKLRDKHGSPGARGSPGCEPLAATAERASIGFGAPCRALPVTVQSSSLASHGRRADPREPGRPAMRHSRPRRHRLSGGSPRLKSRAKPSTEIGDGNNRTRPICRALWRGNKHLGINKPSAVASWFVAVQPVRRFSAARTHPGVSSQGKCPAAGTMVRNARGDSSALARAA